MSVMAPLAPHPTRPDGWSRRFYRPVLGDLLLAKPNLLPAAVFYLSYPVGLVIFAVMPGLRGGGEAGKPDRVSAPVHKSTRGNLDDAAHGSGGGIRDHGELQVAEVGPGVGAEQASEEGGVRSGTLSL